jgi:hypothetical protein
VTTSVMEVSLQPPEPGPNAPLPLVAGLSRQSKRLSRTVRAENAPLDATVAAGEIVHPPLRACGRCSPARGAHEKRNRVPRPRHQRVRPEVHHRSGTRL